ncbi:protein kinase [Bacillus sp. OxB-1]|uniref:hypothetical protein n=1 Tax=Bacillus sp. (strain OxB-1) TaxID=98228 RepID=UPI0005822B81|nr:hypothetical protein [Bacillus sp. OxB-1]BAQ09966.1 protein kinase [Bacillus sp. OxB-1]
MKKFKRLRTAIFTAMLVVLMVGMANIATAAEPSKIPEGAIINPTSSNAFHLDQIGISFASFEIIEALNAKKPVYLKLPGSNLFVNVSNGTTVQNSVIMALPTLSYTDKNGNKTTIPSSTEAIFEVLSIQ